MLSFRNLLALLLVLATTALTVTLWKNLSEPDLEELLEKLPKQVDLALEQIHYTQNEGGRRRWTLDADAADYKREAGIVSLENISLVFYQAGERGEVRMTARQGSMDQSNRQIEVWDQVAIVTEMGDKFYTEQLSYNDSRGVVLSEKKVRIETPGLKLTGTGFEYEIEKGRFRVLKNVHAVVNRNRQRNGEK